MTFIDWSDPEEMIGLLTEFVADARIEAGTDPGAALRQATAEAGWEPVA